MSLNGTTSSPVITVITPAYNVAAYVGEAIDSVLLQTETRFEHLIVDDGSTDGTIDVIDSRMRHDARIRLIRADHGGSAAARNRALQEAKGTYVAFLDGDDRWNAEFLHRQLTLLESLDDEVGAVFCRARVMTEGGTVIFARWQPSGRYDFDDMLVLNCPPRNGSSLLIKKRCFDEAGLFDVSLRSGIDFDMWLRIGLQSSSPVFWGSSNYLLDLRIRPGAISTNWDARFQHMDELLERYTPELRRHPIGKAYIRPALLAFRNGYDDIAERWMGEVKGAGTSVILRDHFGSRVLAWSALSRGQRSAIRKLMGGLRGGLSQGLAKLKPPAK